MIRGLEGALDRQTSEITVVKEEGTTIKREHLPKVRMLSRQTAIGCITVGAAVGAASMDTHVSKTASPFSASVNVGNWRGTLNSNLRLPGVAADNGHQWPPSAYQRTPGDARRHPRDTQETPRSHPGATRRQQELPGATRKVWPAVLVVSSFRLL